LVTSSVARDTSGVPDTCLTPAGETPTDLIDKKSGVLTLAPPVAEDLVAFLGTLVARTEGDLMTPISSLNSER
jgi:hypothetical protein